MLTSRRESLIIAPDMKTQLAASPIFTQGINANQVSAMDMDLEGMKQACQIFRDNIYTDKILAVVREWTCNAIDEHVKHKINLPVEIGVRDQRFFVRDFANGLDDNGIRNVFGKYFRSTKSNSDEPIGGFGVGAKAGHCYNDTFYVTSFHKGLKTVYACVLGGDETGASIGQVLEMSQEPTTETGLLVQIEVKSFDAGKFLEYSERMATLINSCPINVQREDGTVEISVTKKLIHQEDGISLYHITKGVFPKDKFAITMGGIEYKTPDSFRGFNCAKEATPTGFIQIDVPIGFFDIPISRESFRDTFKFKEGIAKCEKIVSELIEREKAQIKNISIIDLIEQSTFPSETFTFKRSSFIQGEIALLLAKFYTIGDKQHQLLNKNGKYVVCMLSNSSYHADSQEDRLTDFCDDKSVRVIVGSKESSKDLVDAFAKHKVDSGLTFVEVRSVLPKLSAASPNGKYSVYRRGYGTNMKLTALELHNMYSGCSHTKEEAIKYNAERFANCNFADIDWLAIFPNGFQRSFSFKSQPLRKDLYELGYLNPAEQKYIDRKRQLIEEIRLADIEKAKITPSFNACKKFLSNRTRSKIEENFIYSRKKISGAERINNRLQKIIQIIDTKKQSECAAIKIFLNYISSDPYFRPSRADIRAVMNSSK